jgi:hypothetical protein
VTVRVERGISAPPEVVFNTAIDPRRTAYWLPEPLRDGERPATEITVDDLRARWHRDGSPAWSARLEVSPVDAGGASVRLELAADPPQRRLREIADESLASLARVVADNLTAG